MPHLYWRGPKKGSRKGGKRFTGDIAWIQWRDNGKTHYGPLLTEDGQRIKDPALAKYRFNEFCNKLSIGTAPLLKRPETPKQILDYYEEACKNRNQAKTIQNDVARIGAFLEWDNTTSLQRITEANLSRYLNQRMLKDINRVTANHTIKNMKTFLNWAVRNKYIAENPVKHMRMYKVDKVPPRFLTLEEIDKVLTHTAGHPLHYPLATSIYAGMRPGEIHRLNLKTDIDFVTNQIMVQKSKTGRFRVVPLFTNLKKILEPYAQDHEAFDFINFRKLFDDIRTETGMTWMTWYTGRYTFCSQLAMKGVPLLNIARWAGSSAKVIFDHYAYLQPKPEDTDAGF